MATYYIRTNKTEGKAALYCKIRQDSVSMFLSTGIEVDIDKWNQAHSSKTALKAYRVTREGRDVFRLLTRIDEEVNDLFRRGSINSKEDSHIVAELIEKIKEEEKDESKGTSLARTKVLYPIKKEYVRRIFNGTKAYEFRRSLCDPNVRTMVIYESEGRGKVVGECQIVGRICCDPYKLWELTSQYAGIDKTDFFAYFKGCDKACAYVLGDVTVFQSPRSLSYYGIDYVLQNYTYVR